MVRDARADALILAEADPIYIKSQLGHKNVSQSYEYTSVTQENKKKNKKSFRLPERHTLKILFMFFGGIFG